jgi:hypothetical protein
MASIHMIISLLKEKEKKTYLVLGTGSFVIKGINELNILSA